MVAIASLRRLGLLAIAAVAVTTQSSAASVNNTPNPLFPKDMVDYLQCQVCQTPELTGSVQDSACDYETVDKAVNEHFHPLLHELSRLTFFRYFKVDLGKECPFQAWRDDGMCASIDCAVCECPSHEIPAPWSVMDQQERLSERQEAGKPCDEQTGESTLSKVDRKNAAAGETFKEWEEVSSANVWATQGDAEEMMTYINLLENPERYTGYSGIQAERIWKAIYKENCFTPSEESVLDNLCLEERVYYRLISGLQASINTHIALTYKYGDKWGVNPSLFVNRVGKHRERLQNLYFAYLFVMRAISKYRHELLAYDYNTGNAADDVRVREILRQLLLEGSDDARATGVSCPAYAECSSVLSGFDESALFRVQADGLSVDQLAQAKQEKEQLEVQFREKFQNVSRIMDCVTCEKCRLWGKLQTMGLGTAIKILLTEDVSTISKLHRNELIALINVANNLSRSVDGVKMMRELEFMEAVKQFGLVCGGAVLLVLILIAIFRKRKNRKRAHEKQE
ncbi:Endoplasmic Reticulum Oxidoreductin 1 (ERO1) [Phytophthora infestans]|uniref:Endoplasmic Reticulum Oxidoreductin 1 (ERO1) n=1 Tax=Phytophthora infestans TaxID=4787 RepID=A0A833WKI8_PHYIN|nr:Endoplasmic Reticulum Oxidoreductin 1 (ERO1) [Phytophthora infestans]KAF4129115.1 Endoplasmic Reticulum Oxidoreductin 1 (ERO1) [Phytophthora infestans]